MMDYASSLQEQHVERRERIASKAVIDRPINLKRRAMDNRCIVITDVELEQRTRITQLEAELLQTREELLSAKAVIAQIRPPVPPHPVHRIIEIVSMGEGISRIDIVSERRSKEICAARMLVYYLAGTMTALSLPVIGRKIGGRDHTTVLHGKRKLERLRITDQALDARLKFYELAISQQV